MSTLPLKPIPSLAEREKKRKFYFGLMSTLVGVTSSILMVTVVVKVAISKQREINWDEMDLSASPIENATATVSGTGGEAELSVELIDAGGRPPAETKALASPSSNSLEKMRLVGADEISISGIQEIESKYEKINHALSNYFAAQNINEKIKWVRDPERVRPLMERFYKTHAMKILHWKSLDWARPLEEVGCSLGYAQSTFEDSEPIIVFIEELDGERIAVDWESAVRYADMPWGEFLEKKPGTPTLLRVLASRMTAQSGNSSNLLATSEILTLRYPSHQETLELVINRSDMRLGNLVEQLNAGQWKDVPITLKLHFAKSITNTNRAQITSVEGRGWLILPQKRS